MLKVLGNSVRFSLLAPGVLMIASCATSDLDSSPIPRRVNLAEFADRSTAPNNTDGMEEASESDRDEALSAADSSGTSIRLGAGSPDLEDELLAAAMEIEDRREGLRVAQPGDRILIDSLVGQINGRPIFADEILLPIEDQLMALSRRSDSIEEFQGSASRIIADRTFAVVRNELILSEAESTLSSEQQQGLLYFLKNLKEEEVAKRGGSREEAERRLEEEEGISLGEKIELEKETALIQNTMLQKVRSRVIVSWHDIEREYERHFDEFNPPQQVTLARIRLSDSNVEQIEDVKARLLAGEEFGEVAERVGMKERGLWDTFTVGPGGVSDIPINDDYKPYLEGLEEGQVTEAFETRGRIMWLQVASLSRPKGRSLYDQDIQDMLRSAIYRRRMNVEQERFMQNLLEKSTVDDLDIMAQRIIAIAMLRYSP